MKNQFKLPILLIITLCCYVLFQYVEARLSLPANYFITAIKLSVLLLFFNILNKRSYYHSITTLFSVFIIYIVLSGWKYLLDDRPFFVYYDALSNFVMPMLMFYVGVHYDMKEKMYLSFAIAFAIPLLLTMVDYLRLSPWYLNYLISYRHDNGTIDEGLLLNNLHFSGPFVETYFLMYLGFPVLAYVLEKIMLKKERSWILFTLVSIFFISLILCQQRTAMISAVFALVYYAFFSKNWKMLGSIFFAVVVIVALSFALGGGDRIADIQLLLLDRTENMSFSSAFGQRQDNVFRVFPVWQDYILGDGVGFYSHAAHYSGYISVNDCGWIKLLVENGALGVLLFLIIVTKTIFRGFRLKYYCEVLIILFFMLAMVGSDSLSMDISHSLFFWYTIGYIWNHKVYLSRNVNS